MLSFLILDMSTALLGAAVGAGLSAVGAGIGIGIICGNAMTAISRQPDAYGRIFPTMLIIAALVEVIALVGSLVAMLIVFGVVPETYL